MKKIALITVYFGRLPKWIDFSIVTRERNSTIDWLIFTDTSFPRPVAENIKIIQTTLKDFNLLARENLGLDVKLEKAYKICDLKPTFGLIFEDNLKGYDFWGHADFDIFWGDIRKYITEDILNANHIISPRFFTCGHFNLYKNCDQINNLFRKSPKYKEYLESKKYTNFDELAEDEKGRYDGFSGVVREAEKSGLIKWSRNSLQADDFIPEEWKEKEENFLRQERKESELASLKQGPCYWSGGKLVHSGTGEEVMYLHFLHWKKYWQLPCYIRWNDAIAGWNTTATGLHLRLKAEKKPCREIGRLQCCLFWHMLSAQLWQPWPLLRGRP